MWIAPVKAITLRFSNIKFKMFYIRMIKFGELGSVDTRSKFFEDQLSSFLPGFFFSEFLLCLQSFVTHRTQFSQLPIFQQFKTLEAMSNSFQNAWNFSDYQIQLIISIEKEVLKEWIPVLLMEWNWFDSIVVEFSQFCLCDNADI